MWSLVGSMYPLFAFSSFWYAVVYLKQLHTQNEVYRVKEQAKLDLLWRVDVVIKFIVAVDKLL